MHEKSSRHSGESEDGTYRDEECHDTDDGGGTNWSRRPRHIGDTHDLLHGHCGDAVERLA